MAFAPRCILCHVPATLELDLCTECRAELPRQTRACRYCALTLSAGSDTDCCPSCLRGPPFDVAHAAFMYDMPIDWLITRLKFQDRLSHARILGTLLAAHLASEACRPPDCIVPVPLHKKRYRQRGFNQAALLAQVVGRLLDRPVEPGLAQRVRATEPQMALPAAARARNVRRAFTASRRCAGRDIAIVDDVVTTGHTTRALADALRRQGARTIQLWCAARA